MRVPFVVGIASLLYLTDAISLNNVEMSDDLYFAEGDTATPAAGAAPAQAPAAATADAKAPAPAAGATPAKPADGSAAKPAEKD